MVCRFSCAVVQEAHRGSEGAGSRRAAVSVVLRRHVLGGRGGSSAWPCCGQGPQGQGPRPRPRPRPRRFGTALNVHPHWCPVAPVAGRRLKTVWGSEDTTTDSVCGVAAPAGSTHVGCLHVWRGCAVRSSAHNGSSDCGPACASCAVVLLRRRWRSSTSQVQSSAHSAQSRCASAAACCCLAVHGPQTRTRARADRCFASTERVGAGFGGSRCLPCCRGVARPPFGAFPSACSVRAARCHATMHDGLAQNVHKVVPARRSGGEQSQACHQRFVRAPCTVHGAGVALT